MSVAKDHLFYALFNSFFECGNGARIKTLLLFLILLTGCSENLFDEIADKDSEDAIYFSAKQAINSRDYDGAITLLASLTPAYLQVRERVPVYASAYAGRCGLEFLALLDDMQNTGGSTVLSVLMGAFPGADLVNNVADCAQAQAILETIGDEAARNGDENLLMSFTRLTKVGSILSFLADADDDGAADATFDQCDNGDLPDAQVREIGASIAVSLLSLAAIGASYIDGALTEITNLCAEDPNLAAFCSTTDPAAFAANEVQALRYAIGSSDYGINSCGGNDLTNCAIANPVCP